MLVCSKQKTLSKTVENKKEIKFSVKYFYNSNSMLLVNSYLRRVFDSSGLDLNMLVASIEIE